MKTKLVLLVSAFALLVFGGTYFSNYKPLSPKEKNNPSNIISGISVFNYTKAWAKIDSLLAKGLSKSALEQVLVVYKNAKAENNAPQFVKAVMYKMKLDNNLNENSFDSSIANLKTEINETAFPIKPVLHSVLAEMYWRFYSTNRYRYYQRTETVAYKEYDIQTWTLKQILNEVVKNYVASLTDYENLKKTKLNLYDDIIIRDTLSRKFRPTLYDFLAHRAVDFFMNDESEITKPAFKFDIDKEEYFKPYPDFVKLNITTKDSLSLKYYAAVILQDLIKFHANDADPSALIDVDLKRMSFVKNNSTLDFKDSLYLQTLLALESKFSNSASSTDVTYAIAQHYYSNGLKYKPLQSDENKWMLKKSIEKCEAAIKAYPLSDGAKNCENLKFQIKTRSFNMTVEEGNAPNKPFRSLVTYKNVNNLSLRIIKMTYENDEKLRKKYYGDELVGKYLKESAYKEWNITLPDDGDFQSHSAEIKIPALPFGYYVLLATDGKTFTTTERIISYSQFWITNISSIDRYKENYAMDFFVTDRETGKPMKSVTAQCYTSKYNYVLREYENVKWKKFTTDENGFFEIPPADDYMYFYVDFSNGSDRFVSSNSYYQYKDYKYDNNIPYKTFFFTDRAIYRPGQTIYFKGIILKNDNDGNLTEVAPNVKTTVTFYDVNYQKISDLELTSNEYGSFTGTFTAPAAITGSVHIADSYGSAYFSVEEYKRPKFSVSINPVKGSYKLNENLDITGTAKAYAGNMIDGANVTYRVVRTVSFPYWWYWWKGYYPRSSQTEIANGTTTTDDKGEFKISFKALPDLSISKKSNPTYTFTVYADVTDINGETHSAQDYVKVGYKALSLSVYVPDNVEKTGKNIFTLSTTNLSGEKEAAKGNVTIYKLKQPDKIFRERIWDRPDKFVMTKDEYYSSFPYDLYDDENNMYKWEKETKVFETVFETPKDSTIKISDLSSWKPGTYILEAKTKDKYGEDVEYFSYFKVYGTKEKQIPENDISYFELVKSSAEPGENVSFILGTKDDSVKFYYEIEKDGIIKSHQWLSLSKEQKLFEIPVTEEYRGNFAIHIFAVKHNRLFTNKEIVTVPYTNKELDIEFETFRDKLLPGQQEEWKIKIKGKNGDKVAAELLATMYDASLDAYEANYWYFDILKNFYSSLYWDGEKSFTNNTSTSYSFYKETYPNPIYRYYDKLNWFGFNYGNTHYRSSGFISKSYEGDYDMVYDAAPVSQNAVMSITKSETVTTGNKKDKNKEEADEKTMTGYGMGAGLAEQAKETVDLSVALPPAPGKSGEGLTDVKTRSNFNETAFFYPQLKTDENGNIVISFTIPEALTKWKFMGLAHTKDLKFSQIEKETVTQKDLMIVPNAPRFFRENDKISFTAKVSNLTEKEMTGSAQLFLFDATTLKAIDDVCKNANATKTFTAAKGGSSALSWDIEIPENISAIKYKVVAKSGNFSDGEEMVIPVLNNRMLVTETMPLPVRGKETKDFTFTKLVNSKSSSTLKNYKLTLEYTSNPAWYAIQALPYMMEYPYECAEQTFSRFYANSIASHIANSHPKIKAVFDSWKNLTPDALLSNLEKNEDLKSLMLEETPWVLQAKNESERKQRVALLFDLNKMSYELDKALAKLEKMQLPNGGFPWFGGMEDDRYITQHVVTGFGHLDNLGVKNIRDDNKCWNMIKDAVEYLDNRMREDYEWLLKYYKKDELEKNHIGYLEIQYLYARSYFLKDVEIASKNKDAYDYFVGQAKKYWLDNNRYLQGMISLALNRIGDKSLANDIIKSLKENSINNDEMGMYWKDMSGGYFWYQAPIETQSLLIEAFDEVANDSTSVENMKVWLLKQKQTTDWKTTKATSEACYALLLRGTNWLASDQLVEISLGGQKIDPKKMDNVKVEAGTGYFKTSWSGNEITPDMGNVKVKKTDTGVSWGALYWQYFEQLDKITPAETPLKLEKKLFVQKNSATGPVIYQITDTTKLKVGDKIKVRIELHVDRDMEYVHMKDMRASGFEPINVISQYKYQDGLGYYESTRDASTNFFFSYLPKGTYVFEYPLWVTHKGDFSNGITTIQCMYAPEFSTHSEGVRVKINE
ncbi:MAG TPA: alpha-2-macroglobulin family protein [Bacteroidales bacterium]|nr:alpha-2-macroglobulin family protein [Bacteroidales bacterium]HPS15794.1 alpha-2-macroglobulin family protein [Bacteroidales bacterium]